jgi:serine/threonine protein kinase
MEIGNFKSGKPVGGPIPKSGKGEARKATRDGDDAVCVLKRMQPAQGSRPERRGRFQREIDALQKLDDPNILKIVDYGVDDRGAPYLVSP